jgi:hypothetical protein
MARREREKALIDIARRGELTPERRDRERARHLAGTPRWYSAWVHLASTTAIGVLALTVATVRLVALPSLRLLDFLVVPIVFLAGNFVEWRLHRHVLHRRRWPLKVAYDLHTAMHHMIYVESDMALRSPREFRLVLMPASGVAAIVAGAAPFAAIVGTLLSRQAGWLFFATAGLFMASYELVHLSYHAPPASFIGRRRLIGILRAHHARHHDPRLMQRYNFNVTVPLFDWILGTLAPPTPEERNGDG